MSAMTDSPDPVTPPAPLHDAEIGRMPRCTRCGLGYLPAKSTSALKLTYCSFFCELGDLGFSIVGLERMELIKKPVAEVPPIPPDPEPIAVE